MKNHPVLYSYRRCPYAMRARMAIVCSGVQVEQREIVFWDKPEPMLQASPKGTVPVLVLPDNSVIDESRDIMFWALQQNKQVAEELLPASNELQEQVNAWIDRNDNEFKEWLDKYKYADRFPENTQQYYRQQGESFLKEVEETLGNRGYLVEDKLSVADMALFPFIRQFVNVDKSWFAEADCPQIKNWLSQRLESPVFKAVMKNRPVWQEGHLPLWVDEPSLSTKNEFTAKSLGINYGK
jgi:glutathione S-transferase